MRSISRIILEESFTENDKKLFKKFAIIVKDKYKDINSQRIIWKYDQAIGGLGGYAAPLNPTVNPFNRLGEYRNVFRSLQYARCDMFCCSRPRNIILDSSLHIECLVKIILSNNKILKFIYNKREFGKNIDQLYKEKIINDKLYDRINNIRKIMNLAKHDTDSKHSITFDYDDAIIFYFEVRKIGLDLLRLLNHKTCNNKYEIDEEL